MSKQRGRRCAVNASGWSFEEVGKKSGSTLVIFTRLLLRPRLVEDLLDRAVELVEELRARLLVAQVERADLLLDRGVYLAAAEVGRHVERPGLLDRLDPDRVE